MSALSIQPPFPIITDIDGQPLDEGFIWIGVANLNPITNPISVYWDAALTLPAVQPIRTISGYPANAGTPGRLYVNSDYSIQVQNKNGTVVYSAPAATERLSSDLVTFIQAGIGAVPTTVQAKLRETVSVKDFGAVGDGVADDTAAVQAAFDACAASGQGLYFPAGTYNASSSLTMGSHDLDMEGTLVYTGSAAITFLRIAASDRNIALKILKSTTDWSSDDLIGVLFTGANNVLYLRSVQGFGIGIRFGGVDSCAYNAIFPTRLIQNRIQIDLNSPTSSEFVNQNTFVGGRIGISTQSTLNGISRIGVRMGGGYYLNNNVFLNMSFGLRSNLLIGGATSIAILAETAIQNQFIGCRCEDGATGAAVVEQNDSGQNQYSFLFIDSPSSFIDYQGTYRSSQIATSRSVESESPIRLVYDSGPVYERANYYNGSTSVFVDGLHFQNSTSSTPSVAETSITINSDNISYGTTRAIGTFVRIGSSRAFRCVAKTKSGVVRWYVACFDAAGNRLTDTDPNHPYVVGTRVDSFSFGTSYGGTYRRSDSNTGVFFVRNSDVHTIQILATGTSELESFQIYADNVCDVYPGVTNLDRRQKLGTAVPSAGTWQVGDMVWDAAPAAGGTLGWICTTAGTPGTWKTFGAISA